MKEVILSHDGEASLYLVPNAVADDLENYCREFASTWIWHGPENKKYLQDLGDGQLCAVFGAADFIDYLNKWAFPEQQSQFVKDLGCFNCEIPEEYHTCPKYNF